VGKPACHREYWPTLDLIVTLLSAWKSGMVRSRVELFEQVRQDWRAGGSSIRELAGRHHVHRRTVRQALASAVPPPRKSYPQRPRPAIGRYAVLIDEWAAGGPGRAAQVAVYRPADLAASGR